ncbi:uncharacterized protein [Lepeophtheirus salmonis]|uniref:uncharacterized protein n=1 Tax=Lepeophtheirus salmonis TaxID=72036 RepID=UPI001AE2C6EC|nr:uncharacterized protein LOC121120195 [Lepeophtheirus salmonis]
MELHVQKALLTELNKSEKDVQIKGVKETPGSKKGDNFICKIKAISVEAEIEGEVRTFEYMCKSIDESKSEMMKKWHIFERECRFYLDLLPLLGEGLKVPRPYYVSNEQGVIFMENLCKKKYALCSEKINMSLQHIELMLNQLSILHASSHKLLINVQIKKKILNMFHMNEKMDMESLDFIFYSLMKSNESALIFGGRSDLADKLGPFKSRVPEISKQFYENKEYDFTVINHGDCWTNNFLFKYDENKELVDICVIDWQMLLMNTPVRDVSHVLGTCLDPSYRKKHLNYLLKYYYERLSLHIEEEGLEIKGIYPYEKFCGEYREFEAHRFLLQSTLISILFGELHANKQEGDYTFEISDKAINEEQEKSCNQMETLSLKMAQNNPDFLKLIIDIHEEALENKIL